MRDEVLRDGRQIPGITTIHEAFTSDWLTVQPVSELAVVAARRTDLDRGALEAIVLMREIQADVLLLDKRLARSHAVREGLPLADTIGILQSARNRGVVPALKTLLKGLRQSGFRLSAERGEPIGPIERIHSTRTSSQSDRIHPHSVCTNRPARFSSGRKVTER